MSSDKKEKAIEFMAIIAEAKGYDREATIHEYMQITGAKNRNYLLMVYRDAVKKANADSTVEARKVQLLDLSLRLAQKAVGQYEKYGKNIKDATDALRLLKEMVLPSQPVSDSSKPNLLPSTTVLDQRSLTAFVAAIPELFSNEPKPAQQASPVDTGTVPEVIQVLPEVHEPGV